MLSYAVRYRPILLELQRRRPSTVLDVGSGPEGLGLFWHGTVTGTDLAFKRRPLHQGVVASSLTLPFADRSYPVVISCDMLEHIPPEQRPAAVREMARVTSDVLFLSFPSGPAAMAIYRELARELDPGVPVWLQEHLCYGLPEATIVEGWLREEGWLVSATWYEVAATHKRLVRWEHHFPVKLLAYSLMRLAGPWLAPRLPVQTNGDSLRVLVRAERPAP